MATTEEITKAAENNGVNTVTSTTANLTAPAYADQNRIAAINSMYDSQLNSQRANLESAYNQNMSDLEANRAKIAQEYQTQRNAQAVNFERNRRNFNQQAMMNGLNTGAFSQAGLAQNNANQQAMAQIGTAEGNANTQLEKSIADLKMQYQSDINDAIAKNDYNRAAALLDEYNQAYSMAMTKAQQLAQYGDFSGYSDIYGADAARQMSTTWALQNPLIAYNLGRISAEQYRSMTGQYPPSYATGGSSGGGGYGGGSRKSKSGSENGGGDGISLDEANGTGELSTISSTYTGHTPVRASSNNAGTYDSIDNPGKAGSAQSAGKPGGTMNPRNTAASNYLAQRNMLSGLS